MMSLRQLEYIQYYVKAMKLIQPTPEAIERYRAAVAETRKATVDERKLQGPGSQDVSDDEDSRDQGRDKGAEDPEEWEIDVSKLADLPLPSSKFFLLRHDLVDIVCGFLVDIIHDSSILFSIRFQYNYRPTMI